MSARQMLAAAKRWFLRITPTYKVGRPSGSKAENIVKFPAAIEPGLAQECLEETLASQTLCRGSRNASATVRPP
jgi:hypothetical protein